MATTLKVNIYLDLSFVAFTLLLLLGLGLTFKRDQNSEWKKHQLVYKSLAIAKTDNMEMIKAIRSLPIEIKQVFLQRPLKVDRCVSCHLGYDNPNMKDAIEPYRTHSQAILERHPVRLFGCTSCHGGQGTATSYVGAAHDPIPFWNDPILPLKLIEARCGTCHTEGNVPGAFALNKGLKLIDRAACFACHEIKNLPGRERIAPNLDTVGSKVHPEWLKTWLMNPRAYLKDTLMPDYGLDDRQALAITAYLMTLKEPDIEVGDLEQPQESSPVDGAQLFENSACEDCHSVRGSVGFEGIIAPDLTSIGDKVKPDWLVRWLKNPSHYQPGTIMPGFGFTDQEAITLAGYLINTFSTEEGKPESLAGDEALESELKRKEIIEQGEVLVQDLGCRSCHVIAGERLHTKIGPELSDVGEWTQHQIEWGDVEYKKGMGLRDFLRIKLKTPHAFGADRKMPIFKFSDREIESIIMALLSFAENPLPMETRVVKSSVTPDMTLPAGSLRRIFNRYQCLACHSLRGRFGRMAPDLGFEGDKVKKEWLAGYLRNPHLIRPLTEKRMPEFGISEEEIQLVADFIDIAWKDDRVPEDPFKGNSPPPELIAKGKKIFKNNYMCIDCHMIGGVGEEVGPKLDRVGERLKPGWIYQWVLDPQLFYENDMISEDVTEEDARALTAYLMSLKE